MAPSTDCCTSDCPILKKGKKTQEKEMLRCCLCMRWYHLECVGEQRNAGVWNCFSCRQLPKTVETLMTLVQSLTDNVATLTKTVEDLQFENRQLHGQLLRNTNMENRNAASEQDQTEARDQTLLVGDSLLRNVDQQRLVKTVVVSKSGGRMKDATNAIRSSSGSFSRIVCCTGTNDCSSESFTTDSFTAELKELIEVARLKEPETITISSIPPRSDSTNFQDNVSLANACIASVAEEMSVAFINNDPTFTLSDGSINDGYLHADGLHLGRQGCKKLISNLHIAVKEKFNGDPLNDWVSKRGTRTGNTQGRNDRCTAPPHRAPSDQHQAGRRPNADRHRCWNCGETNHSARNCRHGQRIECRSCGRLGHKAQHCRSGHQQ